MKGKKGKKIIVNALSVSRIAGACLMPIIFSVASIPALVTILTVLLVTDSLDGILARHWKVQTKGGSLLDPLGDKVLAVACILSFVGTHSILLVPLFLELGITAVNVNRTLHEEEVKSSKIGKIKTWILGIAIVLSAINALEPNLLNLLADKLGILSNLDLTVTNDVVKKAAGLTIGAQVVSGIDYMKDSYKQRDVRTEKIAELKNIRENLIRLFDETKYEEDKDKPLMDIIKK